MKLTDRRCSCSPDSGAVEAGTHEPGCDLYEYSDAAQRFVEGLRAAQLQVDVVTTEDCHLDPPPMNLEVTIDMNDLITVEYAERLAAQVLQVSEAIQQITEKVLADTCDLCGARFMPVADAKVAHALSCPVRRMQTETWRDALQIAILLLETWHGWGEPVQNIVRRLEEIRQQGPDYLRPLT